MKRSYTDLINIYVKDDKQKLKVFDRNGVYLPTKKIGKNNPKAEQIRTDNQYLSSIVQGYGYKNVKEFLIEYRASKEEYSDYQSAVAKWEQQTGNKVDDSFRAKLQQMQKRVKEEKPHRSNSYQRKSDRGAR